MQLANSNQNNDLQTLDFEFYLLKIQKLQKRVTDVIEQLRKPLNYILPPNFQQRLMECKDQPSFDNQWIEKYKDIIAYMIQGQINVTLMGLTKKFMDQFGGETTLWMDLICDLSINEKYDQSLRIWQINDSYKGCLPLPIQQYEKIKKFRKLAKNDISVTKNFLNSLYQVKNLISNQNNSKTKSDNLLERIKYLNQKYQQSNRKMIAFLKEYHQLVHNIQFFYPQAPLYNNENSLINNFKKVQKVQSSNSHSKKSNRKNKNQKKSLKQLAITNFSSISYKQNTENLLLNKIATKSARKQLLGAQKSQFQQTFESMSHQPSVSIAQLRQTFKSQKSKGKKPLLKPCLPYYCTIFGLQENYFHYQNYFIQVEKIKQFKLTQPFKEKDFISYHLIPEDFYEELLGDQIGQTQEDSLGSEEDYEESLDEEEKREIYDFDDAYEMSEGQKEIYQVAFSFERKFGGEMWVFDYNKPQEVQIHLKNRINHVPSAQFLQNTLIKCPCQIPMQYTQEKSQSQIQISQYQLSKLKILVNNKTRRQIFDQYNSNYQIQRYFSKKKLNFFLSKKTKKVIKRDTSQNKNVTIYLVCDDNSLQQKQQYSDKNNKSKKQSKLSLSEQDTIFQEDQQYPEPQEQQQYKVNIKKIQRSLNKQIQQQTLNKFSNKSKNKVSQTKSQNLMNQTARRQLFQINESEQNRNSISQPSANVSHTLTNGRSLRERKSRVNYNEKYLADKAYQQYKARLKPQDLEI